MADRTPIETKNLDSYGHAPLPWHLSTASLSTLPSGTPRPSRTARRAGDSSTKTVFWNARR